MKRTVLTVFLVALCALLVSADEKPKSPSDTALERLKSLAGEWEGKMSDPVQKVEMPITTSIRVTSGGSAVMIVSGPGTEHEMITMIHPDGDDLRAVHYCSMGNQPRMKMVPATAPDRLRFEFEGITNQRDPKAGNIKHLEIAFVSPDHHIEYWTGDHGGVESTATFDLRRTK